MSLASPTSWGLHYRLGFTLTALCINLSVASFRDLDPALITLPPRLSFEIFMI
jgi:hypothetical protein